MFTLQLGHPTIKQYAPKQYAAVRDVLLELFRENEESSYLFWNNIPIALRYSIDLFANFDSILAMTWLLGRDEKGCTVVQFTNQLLKAEWTIQWHQDECSINGSFEAHEDLYASYANALNESGKLEVSKNAFLAEWNTLLHQILVAIDASENTIQDGTERRKMELLQRTEQAIGRYGSIYTR